MLIFRIGERVKTTFKRISKFPTGKEEEFCDTFSTFYERFVEEKPDEKIAGF